MFASTLVSASADRAPVRHTKFNMDALFGNQGSLGMRDNDMVGTENRSPLSSFANEEAIFELHDDAVLVGSRNWDTSGEFAYVRLPDAVMERFVEMFGSDDEGLDFADSGFDFADHKHNRRIAFQNRGGRFGGDVGNRKRREDERRDSDIDHGQRLQMERRETRQMIEDGLAEYYSGEFGRKHRGERGGAQRSRRELLEVVSTGDAESPRALRKLAMESVSRSRQHLSTAEIRRRLGLLDS